ncbi:MAG: hypothetical protein IKO78_02520 [Bacilli bacterium]|nr:hypothetical protein [Bacilli bacterium]
MKILIIVGMILVAILICIINDKLEEKFGTYKADEIMVFIWGLPAILFLIYIALCSIGI